MSSNIKKLTIIAVALTVGGSLIAGSVATARQGAGRTGATHKRQLMGTGKMAKALNLTDSQKTQIKAILQDGKLQAQAIKQSDLPKDQKRTKFVALRTDTRTKIHAVLTPDQRTKAEQLWKNHRSEILKQARHKINELNLTDAQKQQMKSIKQKSRQDIQAVRNNASLTEAQKKEQIQSIRKNSLAQIKALLTPEQQSKMKGRAGK